MTVTAHRPGMRSMLMLVGCEARMVARDTAGLVVPLGLPLLILLTSAGAAGDAVVVDGMTALEVFVLPLVFVIVIAMIGVVNLPGFLAYYRRTGILRRLAVTPASPLTVLLAQAIVSVVQAALGIVLALAVAVLAFGADLPVRPGIAFGVALLTMAAMSAVGMIVAAVAPSPNSAVAIGLVGFLGLGATGGLFGGPDALPTPLADLGGVLPFGAGVDALGAAWAGRPVDAASLLALGGTVVVGAVVAGLLFRWE